MINLKKIISHWMKKEKVIIITEDYEIEGWLYNLGLSKTNRLLSNILNKANRNFIAITDCQVTYKNKAGAVESVDFLQLNMKYIILIKPANKDKNV